MSNQTKKDNFEPIIVPHKTIFYLDGNVEKMGLYQKVSQSSDMVFEDGVHVSKGPNGSAIYTPIDQSKVSPSTDVFTLFAWVKLNRSYPYQPQFREFGFGLGHGFNFGCIGDINDNTLYVDDDETSAVSGPKMTAVQPSIDQDDWNLYAISRELGTKTMHFYLNGKEFFIRNSGNALAPQYDLSNMTLGVVGGNYGGAYAFIGSIDKVVLYRDIFITDIRYKKPLTDDIKLY